MATHVTKHQTLNIGLAVNAQSTKKPTLSKAKIAAAVSKINEGNYKNFQYLKNFSATSTQLTSENYFFQLLPQALNLIYYENYTPAKIIIDKTWPGTMMWLLILHMLRTERHEEVVNFGNMRLEQSHS